MEFCVVHSESHRAYTESVHSCRLLSPTFRGPPETARRCSQKPRRGGSSGKTGLPATFRWLFPAQARLSGTWALGHSGTCDSLAYWGGLTRICRRQWPSETHPRRWASGGARSTSPPLCQQRQLRDVGGVAVGSPKPIYGGVEVSSLLLPFDIIGDSCAS